jgi:UDP-N-acetylmuramoyl-tripeptide--D-alanyl-D-alanine ligase
LEQVFSAGPRSWHHRNGAIGRAITEDDMTLFRWSELAEITSGRWIGAPPTRGDGVDRLCLDSRRVRSGDLFAALRGARADGHDFAVDGLRAGAAAVLAARPVPGAGPVLVVPDVLVAIQALGRAHRARQRELSAVAITGSVGKTTVKEILAATLRAQHGEAVLATPGNANTQLGVPLTLLELTPAHRIAVLELGSDRPGAVAQLAALVAPDVAVITAVGRAHLAGLGGLEGVLREKAALLAALRPGGLAVLPADLAEHPAFRPLLPAQVATVARDRQADVRVEVLAAGADGARFTIYRPSRAPLEVAWSLPGAHLALMAGLAIAVADRLGVDDETLVGALATCRLPPMRMQVRLLHGVTWVNDAYNANPESVAALVDWLAATPNPAGRDVLVLGDLLDLGPAERELHAEVIDQVVRALPLVELLLLGPRMALAAPSGVFATADPTALRARLHERLRPGDRVALKGSRGMALERLVPPG